MNKICARIACSVRVSCFDLDEVEAPTDAAAETRTPARLKMRPSGFFANLDFVIIIKKRRFIIPIISPQIRQDKHKRCVLPLPASRKEFTHSKPHATHGNQGPGRIG